MLRFFHQLRILIRCQSVGDMLNHPLRRFTHVRCDSACWQEHNWARVTWSPQRVMRASDPLNDNDIKQIYPWYHDLVLLDLQLLASTQTMRLNSLATIHNRDGACRDR